MTDHKLEHVRTIALAPAARTAAVRDLAGTDGWRLIDDQPRGHRHMRRLVWRTPDGGEVHYAENHVFGARLVTFGAVDAAGLGALGARISAAVPVETETTLVDRLSVAEEPAEIIAMMLTLASLVWYRQPSTAADDLDPRMPALLARLVEHPNRQVRRAVIIAVSDLVARWPNLAGPVLARRGRETELADLVEAFASVVAEAAADTPAR